MHTTILDAVIACKVDAEGSAVSLSQISSRAGISERTLNRYFPDKEMMIYEAATKYMRQRYEQFADQFLKADKRNMTALDQIGLLIQLQIDSYQRDIRSAKVFVRAYTTTLCTAVYRGLPPSGFDASTREYVLALVEQGIKDGSIRKDAVPMDTYLMISSCFMGLVERMIYIYSVDMSESEHRKKLLTVFGKFRCMVARTLSSDVCGGADA